MPRFSLALSRFSLLVLFGPLLPLGAHVRVRVAHDRAWHQGTIVLNDYGCLTVVYVDSAGHPTAGVARFPQVIAMDRVDSAGRWAPVPMDSVRWRDRSCGTVKHQE
ncbi:MAG: hypothetical protein ACREL4_06470 [Gemmatimonadales bacterium]